MIAAGRGHARIAARLVAAGADPAAREKAGLTAADLPQTTPSGPLSRGNETGPDPAAYFFSTACAFRLNS